MRFNKSSTDGTLNLKWTNLIFKVQKILKLVFFRNENKTDFVLGEPLYLCQS